MFIILNIFEGIVCDIKDTNILLHDWHQDHLQNFFIILNWDSAPAFLFTSASAFLMKLASLRASGKQNHVMWPLVLASFA